MLHGELGVALAAQGRLSRAEEEVELVRRTFPTYPFMAKDAFRVRIVAAVASGRLDDAARLARERPTDLPLGLEEELLCDALRVCANDTLPEGERDRILDELREDSASTRWLDALSPGVRAGATGKRMRVGPSEAEIPDASYEAEPGGRAEDEEHEEEEEEEEAPRARSRGREL
jgi:hypothetical protein